MRCTFVLVILPVLASCTPLENPAGVRIPLTKRGSYTKDDSSFDMDSAIEHTVLLRNKYRQNLINLKRNVGEEAFNDRAEIKPLETLPDGLRKRQATALSAIGDSVWVGTVSIGNFPLKFSILFDTGSADLWVPSTHCFSNDVCPSMTDMTKYYRNYTTSTPGGDSSTHYFSFKYRNGYVVSGYDVFDRVEVAGIVVESQRFLMGMRYSNQFKNSHIDGILGMAHPSISLFNGTPFFNNAMDQGSVPHGKFGFNFGPTGPELFLGGTNLARHDGVIEYHEVSYKSGLWQIDGGILRIGDATILDGLEIILDSGTSFMYGPSASVELFYSSFPDSTRLNTTNGITFYSFPCQYPPDFEISWGDAWWPITGGSFYQAETSPGSEVCISSLMGMDHDLGDSTWVMGVSFMKNMYTIFNFDINAVGFAELR